MQQQLSPPQAQRGAFLLEALIAILIFVLGILGLIGLQGSGIAANTDTRYRIEAARMADRMMSTIQGSVERNATDGQITTDLAEFDHYSGGNDCTTSAGFAGSASARSEVSDWDTALRTTARTSLPNPANLDWYQIRTTPATGQVQITICWQQPGMPVPRKHILTGAIS